MPIITNQATITYQSNGVNQTATSNIASTTLEGPFTVSKTSLGNTYALNNDVTYILTTTNNGPTTLTNVEVVDDLGTGTQANAPLTYIGPAQLYINGVLSNTLTITPGTNEVTFTIPTLASDSIATIVYRASPNGYAPLETGSAITNTASWTANGVTEASTDSNTITIEDAALLTITKAMSPDPVIAGSPITYTFNLTNTGNVIAENVVLTDTFNPAPTDITVSINGVVLPATDYTYVNGTLTINNGLDVPAATYTTNPDGSITINPGTASIIVTGII